MRAYTARFPSVPENTTLVLEPSEKERVLACLKHLVEERPPHVETTRRSRWHLETAEELIRTLENA
jgi:hypothetical protein